MKRTTIGLYEESIGAGEICSAFVPAPLPPDPPLSIDPILQEKLDRAHLALGQLNGVSRFLPDASTLLYTFIRKEAVLSSNIEGTQSSLSDLLMFEADAAPGVPIDDVREVSSYVHALETGMTLLAQGLPPSTHLLLACHRDLLAQGRGSRKAPGEFRKTQNWIGGDRPSRAAFVPPPPLRVMECWGHLENFLNDIPSRTSPLIKAALAHVQFETVHPFHDGNGRIGRLLIPLILIHDKILRHPLLYVSLYFKRHRQTYYDLLQKVRIEGDWEAWLGFFADAVTVSATEAVGLTELLNDLTARDREKVKASGRPGISALQVLDCFIRRPLLNSNQVQKLTKFALPTILRGFKLLEELGIIREITNRQRNRLYCYAKYLDLLNKEPDNHGTGQELV
ncbi:MAG TPA: Fic family protein [Candidatus Ozemobacteraceae bacterium]|nr:Fic family protein [Candidatus Ozemobacteraceae bacterium]